MESIDRLRRHVYDTLTRSAAYSINDMIDGIEREVKELVDERDLLKTQWEAGVDFDQRLEAAVDERADVTLFGVDYTPLPVDAEGVPIHTGDVLDGYGKTIEVVELRIGRSGWVLISRDGNGYADCAAFTHHHAPTVEDVLEELLREYDRDDSELTNGEIIERFAAKLRLAEGEDA